MALFLTLHTRYTDIQWGLFKKSECLVYQTSESKKISRQLIEDLDTVLNELRLTLTDLTFIAVHQGPAPFTTLRVCLSIANGIGFATGLPLVGVNGLEALLNEYYDPSKVTVALLNAFGQEVYYALHDPKNSIKKLGCAPITHLLQELKEQYTQEIIFLGNGYTLYQDLIQEYFGSDVPHIPREMVSLEYLAQRSYSAWQDHDIHQQIMPIYLKDYSTPLILPTR